ncbi:MAG: hypothetical protein A3J65_00060 [Candidatus Buchananbacteria bacterium RIFCSPHIGHO2_02_FULL_45_11b]|uniref:Glycosyltransferase RgtA/B/C/D-like domain-containing protein n=3 Tax=Candidatus Buchananiibacteriota TaxID=1817903 RepID=A0A1G1Y578_9BACT|nr:MAG: hypothetical protein A2663_04185 [Candidatus Buchananbacteria bacterium RIFCSPHIGHO2_01_FULL_46_12]OGY50328.1 MAG: hypothetical protein A3J65_00060 [Candidatus Buchananbacteria bacterium RIFCSPHIGHO2_02_FULL_45_11b]OGY57460.1 MAG: hypothetical protein A3H67_02295 [Candidatus Buchananbacteria bacterium RIFCSPLOWO2_02_FULL_46_11b]
MSTAIDQPQPFSKLPYLIAAHILILLGYGLNQGLYFHQAQLWLLFLGWLVLLLPLLKKPWLEFKFGADPVKLLLAANLAGFILSYFFDGGIYLVSRQGDNNIILLKFAALFLFLLYFVDFKLLGNNFFSAVLSHLSKFKFYYLVILALALRLLIIFYSPAPNIDVFYLLQGGADSIWQGQNPYTEVYYNVYSPAQCQAFYGEQDCANDNYTYLPAAIIISAVFKLFFGDVRFSYIFAIFGCAFIVYFLLKNKHAGQKIISELGALLVLYLPLGLFVLEQSWTDQFLAFYLYLFVYLFLAGLSQPAFAVFGIFLASKQTAFAFVPFLLAVRGIKFKPWLIALAVFGLIVLPFVFWQPADFYYDIVIDQLKFKEGLHSLSVNNLSRIVFQAGINQWLLFSAAGLLLVVLRRGKKDLAGFLHASILFLLGLFFLRRGFVNYYNFISLAMILLIVLSLRDLKI